MNVIGLEVSTSAAKGVLFSAEHGIVDAVEIPFGTDVTNKVTQDPEGMVAAAFQVLRYMARSTTKEIAAIGLVGTWHSMLLLDAAKRPIGPIRLWSDLTAAPALAQLKQDQEFVRRSYQRTGCIVHASYPVYKYYYLARTHSETVRKARFVISQVEYLYQVLTGELAVSRCMASGTGLLNIHSLDWDEELMKFAGLCPEQLSELKDVFHYGGLKAEVAREVGLKAGMPVTVGGADGAMHHAAVGGTRQGLMSLSVGTSGAVRMAVDAPKLPLEPATWCYYLYSGKYLAGAATNGAANCVDWYLDRWTQTPGRYEEFSLAAAEVDVEQAPFFLPFIYGERSPGWDENRPGGFVGLRDHHGPAELYYAILEGVLFNLYQCCQILTDVAGNPQRILVSGGILQSPLWLQLAADLLGRELWTTGTKNDSTVGAALVALASLRGEVEVRAEQFAYPRLAASPSGEANTRLYRKRFRKYVELYHAAQGI